MYSVTQQRLVTHKHVEKSEFSLESRNSSLYLFLPTSSSFLPSYHHFLFSPPLSASLHTARFEGRKSALLHKQQQQQAGDEVIHRMERERERENFTPLHRFLSHQFFCCRRLDLICVVWSPPVWLLPPLVAHCFCDGSQDCCDHLNSVPRDCWWVHLIFGTYRILNWFGVMLALTHWDTGTFPGLRWSEVKSHTLSTSSSRLPLTQKLDNNM